MILTLIAAMAVSTTFAFHQGPKKITPAERTEKMTQELNLSKKQQAKVLALNEKYADAFAMPGMRGPRPSKDGKFDGRKPQGKPDCKKEGCDKKEKDFDKQGKDCCNKNKECCKKDGQHKRPELTAEQKAKMKAMHQKRAEYDKELEKILNKKQYQAYKDNNKRHHGHRGHGPHHGKAPKA